MIVLKKSAMRLALPLLALTATSGCIPNHYLAAIGLATTAAVVQPDAYIEGTHHPVSIYVTPDSAVCDVTRGKTYIGTVRNGFGKLDIAKSKDPVTVACTAIGYEARTAILDSALTFHAAFRCAFDALCEPAARSGSHNQYPGRVDLILPSLQPPAAAQMAAAQVRAAAETAPPEPAETLAAASQETVTTGRLPPLPPTVLALREGAPRTQTPMAKGGTVDAPLGAWRTTTDAARAWWGRDVPHSIAMPSTALLALQRTDGDWGLFDYLGKDGKRGRVWIALSEVRLAN